MILSLVLFSTMDNSYAVGGYPCFFTIAPLQKQVYEPGDTVTIRAVHCHPESTDTATIIIADGMADLSLGSNTLEDYENGKNVIYKESKQAGPYGIAEFNFTIPKSSNTYRYIVLLSPGGMGRYDMTTFFTKKDANKIQISDVDIVNPEVKQGDLLKFRMKVTDGLGKPLPFFVAGASSNYTGCGSYPLESGVDSAHLSDSDRNQYYSTGIVWGWLQIPQGNSGTYELNLGADSGYVGGFESAKKGGLSFKVLGNTTIQNEMDIFAHFGSSETEPSGYADLVITPDPNTKHLLNYRMGNPFDFTAQTKHTTCVSYTDQMPVRVEIKKAQMDLDKAASMFGSNQIGYGSSVSCYTNPQLCAITTIKTIDMVEGPGTFFSLGGQLNDAVTQSPGEYLINFSATYHDATFQNTIDLRVHNVKDYQITEEKTFNVSVDTWYAQPALVSFDKQDKKLVMDINATSGPKVVDVFFSPELLDGQLTVFDDGKKIIDEKSNLSKDLVQKTLSSSHVTVFPVNETSHIEIVGTTAIPEFFTPSLIISVGMGIILVTQFMIRQSRKGGS